MIVIVLVVGFVGGVIGEEVNKEKVKVWVDSVEKNDRSGAIFNSLISQPKEQNTAQEVWKNLKKETRIKVWKYLESTKGLQKSPLINKHGTTLLQSLTLEKRQEFIQQIINANHEGRKIPVNGLEDVKAENIEYKDGKLIFKGSDGKEHIIPLTNIPKEITSINFAEMKVGGQGYAIHYFNGEKKEANGAVLSSGYLKEVEGKWEVWDKVNGKDVKIGEVKIKEGVKGAVFFRGTPKDVKKKGKAYGFKMGNYVWGKSPGDITFTNADDFTLQPSKGDIRTSDDRYCGFASEGGVRGDVKKGGINVKIVNQNDVGLKLEDKKVGGSNNFIEITSKEGGNIEVVFPKGVTSAEVVNSNGKVIASGPNGEKVTVEKGKPVKMVLGEINGVKTNRLDGGASTNNGRVGDRIRPPPKKDPSGNGRTLPINIPHAPDDVTEDIVGGENLLPNDFYNSQGGLANGVEAKDNSGKLSSMKVIPVRFSADWCVPCRQLGRALDAGGQDYFSVNSDKNPGLTTKYGVTGLPTVIYLNRDGREVGREEGAMSLSRFRSHL